MQVLIRIIADGLVIPVVAIGGYVLLSLPRNHRYAHIARGIIAGMTALFFAGIASLFYQDGQRPFEQLGVPPGAAYLDNPGFPSDHALLVFTVTCVVWASTKNTRVAAILLILSILVAAGRVLALVHTPADVVGGLGCAFAAAALVYGRSFFRTASSDGGKRI